MELPRVVKEACNTTHRKADPNCVALHIGIHYFPFQMNSTRVKIHHRDSNHPVSVRLDILWVVHSVHLHKRPLLEP